MDSTIKLADSKGRFAMPDFANAALIVEKVNQFEYRIRKARVIAESDLDFPEEHFPIQLSERDARQVLEMLENPPEPNQAALDAAREYIRVYGHPLDGRISGKEA